MKTIILLSLLLISNLNMNHEGKYTMLCLGDSYTIGEAVAEEERFPMQAVELLKKDGIAFNKPTIIAKTGWTTDELAAAIDAAKYKESAEGDFVTLLIGVNNQYRNRDAEQYRGEFVSLLNTAIHYAHGKASHVFVVSIPDWGVTPFGEKDARGSEAIGKAIDHFNAINKQEALKAHVNYVDITPVSKQAKSDPELIANDGLHPSGKMYGEWAKLLAEKIKAVVASK